MVLRVKRRPRESAQSLIRRFSQKVRRSGVLLEVRKRQFRQRPQSNQAKKRSALRKEEKKEEYKKLAKLRK